MNPQEVSHITVEEDFAGQRLDNFLLARLKGVPKTHVYRIIRSGEVRVNKGRASADTRVQAGDVLRIPPIRLSQSQTTQKAVPAKEFPVLFEDDYFLVVDKPAGVAVHGGSGVDFGVIEQLRQARPTVQGLELVHRLDKETSGLLLVAKKRSALRALQEQMREREVGKTYLALVQGQWPVSKKVLDMPLHKYLLPNGERRVKVSTLDDPLAKRAVSLVKVAREWPQQNASLLEVTIKTGRTHQIRVHLSASSHPILGDDKYGDSESAQAWQTQWGLKRMFLHAWRLQVVHPVSRKTMQWEAALPTALAAVLARLDSAP